MAAKTTFVRCTDSLGRLVVPKEIRTALGLRENEPVSMRFEDGRVILEKCKETCFLCGSFTDKSVKINGVHVCDSCIDKCVELRETRQE